MSGGWRGDKPLLDRGGAVDEGVVIFVRREADVGDAAEVVRRVEMVEPSVKRAFGTDDGETDFDAVVIVAGLVGGKEFFGFESEADDGHVFFGEFQQGGEDRLALTGFGLVLGEPFHLAFDLLAAGADRFGLFQVGDGFEVPAGDVGLQLDEVVKT